MSEVLVQVLPRLDGFGVARHAHRLAVGLERTMGLRSHFVVHEGPISNADDIDVEIVPPDAANLAQALARGNGSPILVHYSNYGYERRGCPRWLLVAMSRWRSRGSRGPLVTNFHELYATGRPWESSFWLSPVQRRLARRMRRLTDVSVTSVTSYRQTLEQWRADTVIELPVFSTIGEPPAPPSLNDRQPRLVVFGSPGLRAEAYRNGAVALIRAAAAVDCREILDVGGNSVAPPSIGDLPVREVGEQSDATVSSILCDSRAGFMVYPADFLAKSSVYAAYCSHRMFPVVFGDGGHGQAAPHWNPFDELPDDPQAVADGALSWYSGHGLEHHVQQYGNLLR